MIQGHKESGFTLVELLFSLLIVGLILHSLYFSIDVYRRLDQSLQNDRSQEWHLFLNLLEAELSHYEVLEVEPQRIYLKDRQSQRQFRVELDGQRIVKKPGHQPYLYGVEAWSVQGDACYINIEVLMNNEQYFSGHLSLGGGREETE